MSKKITVIGAGPGGYVAALKAAILGADVTLIEKDKVGGTCLNRGCIPTKALLMGADVQDTVKSAEIFGVPCIEPHVDFDKFYGRKDAVVGQLVSGVCFLLKKRGVKVLQGTGKLLSDKRVLVTAPDVEPQILNSDAVILAAGSVPMRLSQYPYDGKRVITSDEALSFTKPPESILIVGGGVIGCEFGQFFRKMGTEVTVVELAEHILPTEDADVAGLIARKLRGEGVKLYENTVVDTLEVEADSVTAHFADGTNCKAEYLMLTVGRRANLEGLLDEAVTLEMDKGKIKVNDRMETSMEGVYAIGDLVDTPFLAHVASREAVVAVECIMGRSSRAVYHAVPRCLYTHPEVGAVGMTEQMAKDAGIVYKTGKFSFAGIAKPLVMGQTEGFVKLLVDVQDKLIGAVVVGPQATDLLTELTLAVHLGITSKQLGEVIHPHPTLSEALMEAAHALHGESVHSF